MPYCPHCGFAVNPSFSFYPSCGNKLSNNFSDTAVPVFTSMRIESSSVGVKGFYEGYALDGKPHGEGKVNWDDGDTYDGERTKINYPSDREWDDKDKCYWHIIESYIMDLPEL